MINIKGDIADINIKCDCGGEVFVDLFLYDLWLCRGIKIRCPKCRNWIVVLNPKLRD
jgi:hypothetical protein